MITTPRILGQTTHLSFLLWQHPGATFPPVCMAPLVGVAPPAGGAHPVRLQRICHLFNARDGLNARTVHVSLPMFARPSGQTIRDPLVQNQCTGRTGRHKWKGWSAHQQVAPIVRVGLDSSICQEGEQDVL